MLPDIDSFNRQSRYIDIFNRGQTPFNFAATASDPWILISQSGGSVDHDLRLSVSVDWSKVPQGASVPGVSPSPCAGESVAATFNVVNPSEVSRDNVDGFVETDHCVSIEAEHYTAKVDSDLRVGTGLKVMGERCRQ